MSGESCSNVFYQFGIYELGRKAMKNKHGKIDYKIDQVRRLENNQIRIPDFTRNCIRI